MIPETQLTKEKLIQLNLHNLTSLWQTASKKFDAYFEQEEFSFGYVKNSQWPNRIWSHQPLTLSLLKNIQQVIQKHEETLVFSHFGQYSSITDASITNQGFELIANQYGMSMPLAQPFVHNTLLEFRKVYNPTEAKQWSDVFKACFGYTISPETLQESWDQIAYSLIWYQNEIVGTVILHITEEVAGIHSLGILPKMRGKGFATQAMYLVLNQAIQTGATLATLQASPMAKAMYEKIGFTQQFVLQNYRLKDL
ncbi:hypothetical protein BKI52_34470 [marine bacterium AO1-C]|nr:hypothetical protein BKI52_34470 [marine bacterium AO1-C]